MDAIVGSGSVLTKLTLTTVQDCSFRSDVGVQGFPCLGFAEECSKLHVDYFHVGNAISGLLFFASEPGPLPVLFSLTLVKRELQILLTGQRGVPFRSQRRCLPPSNRERVRQSVPARARAQD